MDYNSDAFPGCKRSAVRQQIQANYRMMRPEIQLLPPHFVVWNVATNLADELSIDTRLPLSAATAQAVTIVISFFFFPLSAVATTSIAAPSEFIVGDNLVAATRWTGRRCRIAVLWVLWCIRVHAR